MKVQVHLTPPPYDDKDEDGNYIAPCRAPGFDPDRMYPERGTPYRLLDAKKVCSRCPFDLKQKCGEYAIATNQAFGVWGGMSRHERIRKAASGTDDNV